MTTLHRRLITLLALVGMVTPVTFAGAVPEKREPPDYDGRGGEPTKPRDVILCVPRIALFPLYVVSEYVIRRPLGAVIGGAERAHIPDALYNFFILNEEHKVGWVPTFFVDFGFKPSAGVYFFWDDAFAKGNDVRLHAATWGTHWLAGSITDRIHIRAKDSLTFQLSGIRRPDYRYYGEGSSAPEGNLSRYAADRVEASGAFNIELGGASRIETGAGFRRVRFHDSEEYRGSSTVARAAQGAFALPNAFNTGYTAGYSRVKLRLDSRAPRPRSQSGLRLDLDAEQGSAPASTAPSGWLRTGAIAGSSGSCIERERSRRSAGLELVHQSPRKNLA